MRLNDSHRLTDPNLEMLSHLKRRKSETDKKDGREEPEIITVLFVPQTPGGELAERLQRAEKRISQLTGEKVSMVEKAGRTVKTLCDFKPNLQLNI